MLASCKRNKMTGYEIRGVRWIILSLFFFRDWGFAFGLALKRVENEAVEQERGKGKKKEGPSFSIASYAAPPIWWEKNLGGWETVVGEVITYCVLEKWRGKRKVDKGT
jgi:hypothetical protein